MDLNEIKWGCRDDLPEYDISLFVACRALSCLTHPTIKRKSCPLSNVWLISLVLFDTLYTPPAFQWQGVTVDLQPQSVISRKKRTKTFIYHSVTSNELLFKGFSYQLNWINIKKIHFTLSVGTLTLGVFTFMFNWIIVRVRGGENLAHQHKHLPECHRVSHSFIYLLNCSCICCLQNWHSSGWQ